MYYIRTADRLQRTAPWVESLDGGLDRVREVVVDDALGLGSELEAAMARHVDGYRDEWAATLEDPDKLRRFVSFVNAPGVPDPSITFRDERDQQVPVMLGDSIPVGAPR
jgi:nitrite reductase (NADH) large subunit